MLIQAIGWMKKIANLKKMNKEVIYPKKIILLQNDLLSGRGIMKGLFIGPIKRRLYHSFVINLPRKEVIPVTVFIFIEKKEDSAESSVSTIFGVLQAILNIFETAQDLGLEINFIIAYRR